MIQHHFKYYNFIVTGVNYFFHSEFQIKELIVPLGISFITFQQIAFLLDTYRNETLKYKFTEYALFINFFPHISSGPIITHKQFFPYIEESSTFQINWDNIAVGLYMFVMGLGKKVLIADILGKAVDWGYSNISELNSISAVFIMLSYTFQIYFDFSGYSDMAMGIGRLFNIELPINFNSPYKATSILEFWDRWHMTLTNFFTKYLYIPLGGSRKGVCRTMLNTMIVFICSGIWHGTSWTFILWGFLHGMVCSKTFSRFLGKVPRCINQVITFLFVNITWILFRAGSFTDCKAFFKAMIFSEGSIGSLNTSISDCFTHLAGLDISVIPQNFLPWVFIFMCCIIAFRCKNVQENAMNLKINVRTALWTLFIFVICVLSFSDVTTYIYNGF